MREPTMALKPMANTSSPKQRSGVLNKKIGLKLLDGKRLFSKRRRQKHLVLRRPISRKLFQIILKVTTTGEDFIMSMDDVELKEQQRAEKLAKLESGELVYINGKLMRRKRPKKLVMRDMRKQEAKNKGLCYFLCCYSLGEVFGNADGGV